MLTRLLLLALIFAFAMAAQNVKGTLTVNGKTVELTHVYGFQVPDRADDTKTKMGAVILLTDREVPAKLLKPDPNPFDLRDAGVNGMTMDFYYDGSNYALNLVGSLVEGSISISGTFDKEKFTTYEPSRVELATFSEQKKIGDTELSYTLEFATDLEPHVEKPKYVPNQKDIDEAAKSPVTKAYLEFQDAMKRGDLKALETLVVPERAEMMKDPDFKERFDMIKEFMAKDVKVLRVQIVDDQAELLLTGTMFDEPNSSGKVELELVNGKWLVGMERWGSTD
ncbi:MAG: hypothetical protein KIT83_22165 [Bryobacterales bacterium]|nr:hypothetical protein [Bryobacterales bacterium]